MNKKLIKDQNFSATKRHENSRKGFFTLCFIVFFVAILFPDVQAGYVTIGGMGVAADTTGYGGVNYSYKISQFEVTGAEFNQAAAEDSRVGSCTSTTPSSPAENVSWYEAAMYCNWLTSGDAYSGAYRFNGSGAYLGVNRASAVSTFGTVYALPTEDEWYKAAYWTGNAADPWSLYANGTDTLPPQGSVTGWNYWLDGNFAYGGGAVWPVGYGAQEQNGTYDMMGNVWEWTEASYGLSQFVVRGGAFGYSASRMSSSIRGSGYPADEHNDSGFRVVMIPEPATALLFGIGGIGAWLFRRNRIKNREDAE